MLKLTKRKIANIKALKKKLLAESQKIESMPKIYISHGIPDNLIYRIRSIFKKKIYAVTKFKSPDWLIAFSVSLAANIVYDLLRPLLKKNISIKRRGKAIYIRRKKSKRKSKKGHNKNFSEKLKK